MTFAMASRSNSVGVLASRRRTRFLVKETVRLDFKSIVVFRQSFVPVQGRKVQHLFIPEIRRMKHPRCFPKLAWCSPTASAWCAVATRPLRYISQNHVCAFCFVSNFRPSKHSFEKCTAKVEQQSHTTRTQLADTKRA